MKKILLFITILVAVCAYNAEATEMCQDTITDTPCIVVTPVTSCTNLNYSIHNKSGDIIENGSLQSYTTDVYYFNWSQTTAGEYYVKLCSGTTREFRVGGNQEMAGLSVTIFVLAVAGLLFALPFIKRFTEHELVNFIITRGLWSLALWIMVLNVSIIATIAKHAGLPVTDDLFRVYLPLFGWAGYLMLLFLVFNTIFKGFAIYKEDKMERRMNG